MVFKNFKFICVLRIIFIILTSLVFVYLISNTQLYTTSIILGIVIILQIYGLLKYIDKTNTHLARFFNALEYSDYTQSFASKKLGASFDELNQAFSIIFDKIRELRGEREENYRYLHTVIQHVGIGLIAYTDRGEVDFINNAAKKMLNLAVLRNINDLDRISPEMTRMLKNIKPGKKQLAKVNLGDELLQLSLFSTELILNQRKVILVSFQNISSELSEKEMEAWQNLIRILTHEIKNSLTPITSMASTLKGIIKNTDSDNGKLTDDTRNDVLNALQTIQNRSKGLLIFVDSYKDLTHIPKANFKIVKLYDFFKQTEKLILEHIGNKPIVFRISVDPKSLEITADPELLEQVIINLVLNSIQAVENRENGRITLEGRYDERNRVIIKVSDNGPGIVKEALDKIFIPFYTTKKTGSGIGLSLSRQIMRIHRGNLLVRSEPDIETTFTIQF